MRGLGLLIALLVGGCGVTLRTSLPDPIPDGALAVPEVDAAACMRARSGAGSPYRDELPGAAEDPAHLAALARLPADVRRTAVAAGIEPLLGRYLVARDQAGETPTLEVIALRQRLDARIASLPTQMLATELECECVIALLTDVVAAHDGVESDRELALTIASLVAGAAFSLAAGVWDLADAHTADPAVPDGPLVTAITGAVVTTALGVSVVVPQPRPLYLAHAHNLLGPIHDGDDADHLYPTFVFRMLDTSAADGEPSPRQTLLARWAERIDDATDPSERATVEALLFGEGGVYDARIATLRRVLHEDLEATLDSLAPHVDLLVHAIDASAERE